jgi:hypothetical protein
MSKNALDDFKKVNEAERIAVEAEHPVSNVRITSKSRRKYNWMTIEDEQEIKKAAAQGIYVKKIARIFNYD